MDGEALRAARVPVKEGGWRARTQVMGGDVAAADVDGGAVSLGLWIWALAAAWAGTAIIFDAYVGINWGIWVTILAAGLVWSATRRGRRIDPVAWWAVGLAVIVSWGAAVTDNMLFQGLIIGACAALLATAARVVARVPGTRMGIAQMLGAPAVTSVYSVLETGRRAMDGVSMVAGGRSRAVVRGLAIAAPVAAVFALLLAGADPVLARLRDLGGQWIASLMLGATPAVFVSLGVVILGTFGMALRGHRDGETHLAFDGVPAWSIGQAERTIVIASVAVVFGLFLVLQPAYLFGDLSAHRISGVSYADYARRGFGELTVAATACAVLILVLDRHTRREANPGQTAWAVTWGYWCPLLLIGEVLVVLVSAWHRVSLYEAGYGYTMLRVYVQACIVGVAIALVLLASELAGFEGDFDGRRVDAPGCGGRRGVSHGVFVREPERWVVNARNIDRYRATGKLDIAYLADLSINGAPAVVAAVAELPPSCGDAVRNRYRVRYQIPRGDGVNAPAPWFERKVRRRRGLEAVRAVIGATGGDRAVGGGCAVGDGRSWYGNHGLTGPVMTGPDRGAICAHRDGAGGD